MYADISQPPKPLPQPDLRPISDGISLLPPLSRRGHGPGLIILVPDYDKQLAIEDGVPSPLIKWAEEGFTVVEIQARAVAGEGEPLMTAILALKECDKCEDTGKVGLVAYNAHLWNQAAPWIPSIPSISATIVYANQDDAPALSKTPVPILQHLAGPSPLASSTRTPSLTAYSYPAAKSHLFAVPFTDAFSYSLESVSHTRNLTFVKPLVGGPHFDLEAIWEEHTWYEFADRSVEHTMGTMVQEPYVNHVTTLTGGIGRQNLTSFYRDHFIFNNSADTELELVSRTVGVDRVIDEFIMKFTHDLEVDWLIPGIPPTGRKLEIPMTSVVNIRGDRLYHEHIAWDQGTVLRQLDLLPEYLPYPHPLPDGRVPADGCRFEYKVPVVGVETARKLRDRDSVASNELFGCRLRETRRE
ncbi:hypothetical protein CONLIGDRAFT_626866 [Coniochaeta ligniaria NRRL 30616]|uniref:NTF2-like protein n=1 Tax=Coniochaeta ligniaria NRRL 30616 TaxID=1408157 RepID=A0A1J7J5R8_9PEZI|nr:hypothetical protein CONLIGDRAFT_626866 [Coniochaeta ligniaria NRRL 30616]